MTRNFRKRGSSLGMVTVTMVVVVLLLSSCLTLVAGSISRNRRYYLKTQTELTVKSVAQAIGANVKEPSRDNDMQSILEAVLLDGSMKELSLDGFPVQMGQVFLAFHYAQDKRVLSIRVRAVLEQEESVVVLRLEHKEAKPEEITGQAGRIGNQRHIRQQRYSWEISGYDEDL